MKKNSVLIGILLIAIGVLGIMYFMPKEEPMQKQVVKEDDDAVAFFRSYGYEIEVPPVEIKEMVFPKEMDKVYERYNNLQKESGYDITPYLGKTVVRKTYIITNYFEDHRIRVVGNLFLYQDQVIAGDIMNVSLGGFMHSLGGEKHPL